MGIRKEDVISRYWIYDRWKVVVTEVDGRIAGFAGWTVKEMAGGGEEVVGGLIPAAVAHFAFL